MEKWKWLFATVGGALSVFSRQYSTIVIFVCIAIIMDIVTGLVKSKALGQAITSKRGTKGFWKKTALLFGLFFGFFLDYFIPFMLSSIGIKLPLECAIFGMIIGCYIVINECISISENLYKINPQILPKWISNMLIDAKEQIDTQGEKKDEDRD